MSKVSSAELRICHTRYNFNLKIAIKLKLVNPHMLALPSLLFLFLRWNPLVPHTWYTCNAAIVSIMDYMSAFSCMLPSWWKSSRQPLHQNEPQGLKASDGCRLERCKRCSPTNSARGSKLYHSLRSEPLVRAGPALLGKHATGAKLLTPFNQTKSRCCSFIKPVPASRLCDIV